MTNPSSRLLRIALPTPLRRAFDYIAPDNTDLAGLQPGVRVRVPFQQRQLIGILLEVGVDSKIAPAKMKQAIEIIDEHPVIPEEVLQLCLWAAAYYHYPIGEVIDSALPTLLRQGQAAAFTTESYYHLTPEGLALDLNSLHRAPKQREAMSSIALHPQGMTKRQLAEHHIDSAILKALHKKGWIENTKQVFTYSIAATQAEQSALALNAAQQAALSAIENVLSEFQVVLLDGITGSGKTEVYLQAIAQVLASGKQVLVLVPEIGLTPQTLQRFRSRFAVPVVALHSGLSDKERLNAWLAAQTGSAKIIIGTRSAIFSPFENLGLIVVDEEHDLSFKQQEGFRYHARDLAVMRAQAKQIPIILGSATPSLETLSRAQQGRYLHLRLPERAGGAEEARFCVLDIRNISLEEGLSPTLLKAVRDHLDQGDQVMLFLNRRGFAPVLMCHACGWSAKCTRCDIRMTFHHEPRRLHCHHCDSRKPIPPKCTDCGVPDLQIIGLGTERLEQVLQKHFPDMPIARLDRDSTQRKGSLDALLEGIHKGEYRILIGTQMLAKGHHFPQVTLVGIVDTDGGFFSSDFRAIERMGQLVLQVAGRAGRDAKPGTVILQTRHPDNPLLHQLLRESYHYFASSLLKEREQAMMPPYAFLALFRAEAHNLDHATQFLTQIKKMADSLGEEMPIWGPVPAPMPRRAGKYRMQLLVQSKQRPTLHNCLKRLLLAIEKLPSKHTVRWSLDIDPLEMF